MRALCGLASGFNCRLPQAESNVCRESSIKLHWRESIRVPNLEGDHRRQVIIVMALILGCLYGDSSMGEKDCNTSKQVGFATIIFPTPFLKLRHSGCHVLVALGPAQLEKVLCRQ